MTNLGNRSQIWPGRTFSPGLHSITEHQMIASTKAHTPIKTSMNTFTTAAAFLIHSGWYMMPSAAFLPRIRPSVTAPAATAAPSVLTARPIHAPATIGSLYRNVSAKNGRMMSSTTAKITTRDETMIGTTGRALIAPPVAIAADTPQIEMPEAKGAAHSLLNLKYLRAMK